MNTHPSLIVNEIIKMYGPSLRFEFSHYTYVPKTIEDNRETFQISAKDLAEDKLKKLCDEVPPGKELALNSRVFIDDGSVKHIPMIDLATRAIGIIGKVLEVMPQPARSAMVWFESGRSYHGYGRTLITDREWVELMGRFLLVNHPQLPPVVDPRWIGHRLIGGYASLRWTKNTGHYLQRPELLRKSFLSGSIAKSQQIGIEISGEK